MKAFIVLLAVAAAVAEPEADAQFMLNPYMYSSPYMYNTMYNTMPMTVAQPSMYYSKPIAYQPVVYKAEDDKKPEDDKTPEVKPVEYKAMPMTYNAMSYAAPASPMYYALNPTYYGGAKYMAQSAGGVTHTVLKREAEAMAPMVYTNPMMSYYGNPMMSYASPMMTYSTPMTYATTPAAVMPAYYSQMMYSPKTYANDAMNMNVYAAKGQYVADSVGARHVAKREAEAQWPYYTPSFYSNSYMPYSYNTMRAYTTPYTYSTMGYPYSSYSYLY